MAAFQFFHEQTYAQVRAQGAPTTRSGKPSRGRRGPGKISVRDVIHEAVRLPGNAPHVAAPAPANVLYGLDANALPAWYDALVGLAADQRVPAKTKFGNEIMRRQRSDTPIVLGAIASYPGSANEDDPEYVRWRELTVTFFVEHYGDALVTVLEHTDEAHGHLHAIAANAGGSVKSLHAGHAAAAKCTTSKQQSAAYRQAERALQDKFQAQVAVHCNLERVGPRRRRLTRAQWRVEQEARAAIRAEFDAVAEERRKLDREREALQRQRNEFCDLIERVRDALPLALQKDVATATSGFRVPRA
jgi:hypothetical protein